MAYTEERDEVWFAPAGFNRGGLNQGNAGVQVLQASEQLMARDRDTLYEANINPIATFVSEGLVVFGQKTLQVTQSALDRINVSRLAVFLRTQLDSIAKPFIFEPNDELTRNEIKQAVESFLLELVGQRALFDFLVVCDDTNNTPTRIDRNELYVDIAIEPVKSVEFIYIPLRIKNTGEIAKLGN